MKQLTRLAAVYVGLGGLILLLGSATGAPAAVQDEAPPKFIGVSSCKKCHNKSSIGKQYKAWQSKKHAGAFELLKGERAAEVAKKAGVEGPAFEAPACLSCHTTAYGLDPKKGYGEKFEPEEGVTCEACHGAGEFFGKPEDGKLHTEAHGKGYTATSEELCRKCHNDTSPTWDPERDTDKEGNKVGFDYPTRLKMILHPIPKEEDKK